MNSFVTHGKTLRCFDPTSLTSGMCSFKKLIYIHDTKTSLNKNYFQYDQVNHKEVKCIGWSCCHTNIIYYSLGYDFCSSNKFVLSETNKINNNNICININICNNVSKEQNLLNSLLLS